MKDIFLLDLDDTLLDFQRAEKLNFMQTLEAFSVKASEDMYARFHAINDGLWKALERGETTRERLKEQRFAYLFAEYGLERDVPAVAKWYYENFANICIPFAGANDFLKELSARGRVYIVTNGGTLVQKAHLRDSGFLPYITDVFISEEIGCNKPTREYAIHVEEHIENYERSRAVWIGDSLTSDMVCAKTVGIDFILYLHGTMSANYVGYVAHDFNEVLSILSGMV